MTDEARKKVEALAERVKALTPADKLRLAAGLLEQGLYDQARPIIQQVSDDLALLKFLHNR